MKSASQLEEEILRFWQEHNIFEKSLELRRGAEEFVFFDGPPFATGLPHYGHILASVIKDVIPRYQTMRGKYVPRRWGWDCHGLPLENIIEQELGLAHKKDIERYGIAKFNAEAERAVLRYAADWKRIMPRIGRWVDMENDYRTMDWTYTESVWWAFKTLHEKNLMYEGYKSMHICPRCETTLANFEVSQGYKTITDISVTVKFEIIDDAEDKHRTYVLAWTTTPWTLPGNVALVVNKDIAYIRIKYKVSSSKDTYIIAKERSGDLEGEFEILEEFPGTKLVGKKYKPLFEYYSSDQKLEHRENGWKIYAGDFVSTEEGTGVVHIAPAFGEDDMRLGKENNLPFVQHVAMDGTFKPEVKNFAGLPVKPKEDHQKTDIEILKFLHERGAVFAKKKISHSYPFCWRCETPLLNYAASSWFVNVTALRPLLLKTAKKITWMPPHMKEGRFGKGLETAPDWAISRARYWGAPLPVWKCQTCSKEFVAGALEDLELHRFRKPNTYLLMRHGEREDVSEENDHPKSYGPIVIHSKQFDTIHVSQKGKADVRSAAETLRREGGIDLIYSSDFIRTQETAEIISELLNAPLVYDEHVRELNHGDSFEGKTVADYYTFFSSPEERFIKKPEGGETLREVKKRMMQALREIETTHEGKRVLIVSHGDPLWMLEGALRNMDEKELLVHRDTRYMKQGEIRQVELKNYPYDEEGRLNMHRPYIDALSLKCDCGGEMRRIPEVFDCWFESGSMPYAQSHYPFDQTESTHGFTSADFIAEGLDQTRGWFYSMHVLAAGLFEKPAYTAVVVNGIILAEDGQKMSKRLKNYPDPMEMVARYGADALRLYLLLSPAVMAEDLHFSERGVDEIHKKVVARLLNVLSFYEQYPSGETKEFGKDVSLHTLDKFILVELQRVKEIVEKALDAYQLQRGSRAIAGFADMLSTIYIQYSRDRFKDDAPQPERARRTLRFVLTNLAKIMAPCMPFLAEHMYRSVKPADAKESVHLEDWPFPDARAAEFSKEASEASGIPDIVEAILAERSKAGIPVRQPLRLAKVRELPKNEECREVIRQRVNVERLEEDGSLDAAQLAWLDTEITPELRDKGMLREFTRGVQEARKKMGLKPSDHITLHIRLGDSPQGFFERHKDEILRVVHADALVFADEQGGNEIDVGEYKVSISVIRNL
ncbi:MAG: isoleucyl-tRNA synthetase [Parcubacteria group bacterium Gr01-1014_70]|nr:MAG: isoleucyl-tRNA synthetase [Parcubacteria group bacterium Gr01-1014_70]